MRLVRAVDWLWRCLINHRWNYSLTILLYTPARHNYHCHLQTWQLREKSWSVTEQLCVSVYVSFWQPVLSCGHARLRACLQESFIIQLLIPYSSQIAWSQHQSLTLLRGTAKWSLIWHGFRQSEQGYPSKSWPCSCVQLTELILSLIILSKSSLH